MLKNKKVSFIKMDVERSEYQSLLGCQNTIKRYHPRMAISVYHLAEDIYIYFLVYYLKLIIHIM